MTEKSIECENVSFKGAKIDFGPAIQDAIHKLIADEVAAVQTTMTCNDAALSGEIASLELRIAQLERHSAP